MPASSPTQLSPGDLAHDIENDDDLLIIEIADEKAGEKVVTYDYNQNPVTVADYNEDCDPDETVISGVYLSTLVKIFGEWENQRFEYVKDEVLSRNLSYSFPLSRLEFKETVFNED